MKNIIKDLGIIDIVLSNDKESMDIINFAKEYYAKNPYSHVCIFNSFSQLVTSSAVPILHLSQAKFFYGSIIATDIDSLEMCIDFPNVNKIIFFAQSIPWANELSEYSRWNKLFESDNLEILAQNQYIYDILDICWKTPIGISERLDYESVSKIIQ